MYVHICVYTYRYISSIYLSIYLSIYIHTHTYVHIMVPAYGDIMGRSEMPLTGRVPPCTPHTHMHCICNICAVHTPMAGGVAQHIYCICNAYATRRPPAHHRGVHVRTKPKPTRQDLFGLLDKSSWNLLRSHLCHRPHGTRTASERRQR